MSCLREFNELHSGVIELLFRNEQRIGRSLSDAGGTGSGMIHMRLQIAQILDKLFRREFPVVFFGGRDLRKESDTAVSCRFGDIPERGGPGCGGRCVVEKDDQFVFQKRPVAESLSLGADDAPGPAHGPDLILKSHTGKNERTNLSEVLGKGFDQFLFVEKFSR